MSEPRGPTTEELRARVLAQGSATDPWREGDAAGKPSNGFGVRAAEARPAEPSTTPGEAASPDPAPAIVEVLDALLDCGYCELRPEAMRGHVLRLRSYYSGATIRPGDLAPEMCPLDSEGAERP